VNPNAFASAVHKLSAGNYGKLQTLRVAPERIDATLVTKDGRIRVAQINPGGVWSVLSTSGPGFPTTDTVSTEGIRNGAPAKLAKKGAKVLHENIKSLNYLVYSLFGSNAQWSAYFKDGHYVIGDKAGNYVRAF
jgi:hypothetical protein